MLALLMTKGTRHASNITSGIHFSAENFQIENSFSAKHVHFRSNLIELKIRYAGTCHCLLLKSVSEFQQNQGFRFSPMVIMIFLRSFGKVMMKL